MLKLEKLSNSPNKTSDDCYGMKFDLSNNHLQHKDDPVTHFIQWVKMGVAWKHVANAAFPPEGKNNKMTDATVAVGEF